MMRILTLVLAGSVLAAGCGSTITDPVQGQWQATLVERPGFPGVAGTATVTATATTTTANATLTGATPGAVHPWHVHVGSCATDGPIFGPAGAYPPFQIATTGSAAQSATISLPLQAGEQYFVNVHASPTDLATIVACGDLVLQ